MRLKRSVIWSAHVSPTVALSLASYHEHIIFLILSSFHHYTKPRSKIGTTRATPRTLRTSSTSPRPPSRQAAPSRTENLQSGGNPRKTFFTKPSITVYKNTWRVRQNTVRLVQSEAPSKKRIALLSNTIPRDRSFQHTVLAICVEKVVYMKTG